MTSSMTIVTKEVESGSLEVVRMALKSQSSLATPWLGRALLEVTEVTFTLVPPVL
jgi:hypothetical protein